MTARPTTSRRVGGDEGAVLVELALMLPLLVLLSVGVLEYGAAWNDATAAERALLSAGRVLSNEGNARQADQEALLALSAGLEPGTRSDVRKVIIYKANSNDTVPASCKSASTSGSPPYGVAGLCNVYTGSQVTNALTGTFTGANCTGGWDARWCPTGRVRDPNPDRVGIYAEIHYDPVTGLLPPGGITLDRYVVYQLEPPTAGG
jgi:Flp pilus assembly protein TadG